MVRARQSRASRTMRPRSAPRFADDAEAWRLRGLARAVDVVLDLRFVDGIEIVKRRYRPVVPIDPQIHDRPGDLAHDADPGGMNWAGLAALVKAGLQRREQPIGERFGWGCLIRSNH